MSMSSRTYFWIAAIAVLPLGLATSVSAAPITFAYEAELQTTFLITDSPDGTVGAFFNVGDTVRGEFTYETTTPEAPPALFVNTISSASLRIGGTSRGFDIAANG